MAAALDLPCFGINLAVVCERCALMATGVVEYDKLRTNRHQDDAMPGNVKPLHG